MDSDDKTTADIPTIRLKAIGDMYVVSFNIKIGATLKVDDQEVI
jgi:hypothetical protein